MPQRYEVALHTYGSRSPWEPPEHKWVRLNRRGLGKDAAVALADAQPCHAAVLYWMISEKVHDNGRPPGPHGTQPALPAPACAVGPKSAVTEAVRDECVRRDLDRAGVALPKIVRFFEPDVSPGGGASCPHCGAPGSVIHIFQVEDGRRLGAMSGCVKLFPVSPVAREDLKLREKEVDYAKRGWKLASWDEETRAALDDFYAGAADERSTLDRIGVARARKRSYWTARGRR